MRAITAATFLTSSLKTLFMLVRVLQYFLLNGHCFVSYAVADRQAVFRSLIRFGRGSFKPDNHSTVHYFPWANMARHVSIFLWLRTPPSIWILNLTRVPLFLRVLHIISRCLEQITQRNWAILMSQMATFRPYLLFIVLSMWLSIRHVMIRPHANGMTRFPRIKILLFISG